MDLGFDTIFEHERKFMLARDSETGLLGRLMGNEVVSYVSTSPDHLILLAPTSQM